MNYHQMYFETKHRAVLIQIVIAIVCLTINYKLSHWFSLIPGVMGMFYLIIATWASQLAAKDIEIDQTPANERSPSQNRLQSFKIVLDWSMVILQTLIIILTAVALVLDQVTVNL